ncbi:MAG: zinc ribbon domain-containing protein [Oscillospiraceae bacterium]|nr:zinc ribbon domain-containing protein [Oscillospiraceae bacterium]
MIFEILAVIFVGKKCADNEKARGRKGGIAYLYTFGIIFGFEIVLGFLMGLVLGATGSDLSPTLLAIPLGLFCALIGSLISISISKRGSIVEQQQQVINPYWTPNDAAQPPQQQFPEQQPYQQPYQPVQQPAQAVFCPACGNALPQGARFCDNCGMSL